MNITCPHCQAKLNLPEERIPRDRDTAFKCPKCRETIQIKARQPEPKEAESGPSAFSHGAEVLVCLADEGARGQVAAAVRSAGWTLAAAGTVDQALEMMEYQVFPLVIMDDLFDSKGKMAAHLSALDMSIRRRICLVRFSSMDKTGDAMAALHASCNFVVRTEDAVRGGAEDLASLLISARTDHDNFYRVYRDSMRAAGKA